MSETETNEPTANLPAMQEERPLRTPIMAGAVPRAIVPVDFDGAFRIANVIWRAGMAPKGMETVEKCMVAIMHGMEVGLTPMMALQSIAVINGKPTIYGDGAIGLCLASPLCEDIEEFYEGTDGADAYKAVCIAKRKGHKPVRGEFSIADAKTAGLWTKRGRSGEPTPWQTYPKRMLKFRARWALRDAFADVLKGLALREEVEDMVRLQEPTPAESPRRRAPAPPSETSTAETTTATTETTEEVEDAEFTETDAKTEAPADDGFPGDKPRRAPPPSEEEPFDEDRWLQSLQTAYADCNDTAALGISQGSLMMTMKGKVSPEAWKAAVVKTNEHLKRLQP